MATFYIQLENKLLQISGELTAENISKALGYVPVSPNVINELSQRVDNITFDSLKDNPFLQDGSGELNIVDEAGNIIAKIDADGIHSVDFIARGHRLTEKADKADVPTKLSKLINDSGFITKSEVPDPDFESLQGSPFAEDDSGNFTVVDENGNIGMQLNKGMLYVKEVVAGNNVLSNKVDKIEGKGLSTEDFTTALKERLLSLSNFDSTEIEASIGRLQQQIDTLVNGNASEAIDTFNEIIAFLEGVEDTESLSGIIASIERQIANIRVPVNVSEFNNDAKYATEEFVTNKVDEIDFSELLSDDESGELNVVDENGNIGMKISSEAVYAKEFIAGGHKLSEKADKKYVDEAVKNVGGGSGNIDLSDYETKLESQAKLQEAKDYTDARIAELQEGVVTQTIELIKGYNWISFYVKTSLQDLQSALGNKATLIGTSDNGSAINIKSEYNAETNTWSGNLTELNYTSMYQIHCPEACSIELKGAKLNPSELEYTIVPGTTWINYPLDKELSIAEALAGLSPAEGDQLKGHTSAAQYYNDFGWWGTNIQPMIPGKGYMYVNSTNETKTFYFPSDEEENISIPQIIYIPNESSMPDPPVEGVLYLIGEE